MLRKFPIVIEKEKNLRKRILGLQFWLRESHFDDASGGKLRVRCLGQIPAVYEAETDEVVVGEFTVPHKALEATSVATATHLSFSVIIFAFAPLF